MYKAAMRLALSDVFCSVNPRCENACFAALMQREVEMSMDRYIFHSYNHSLNSESGYAETFDLHMQNSSQTKSTTPQLY